MLHSVRALFACTIALTLTALPGLRAGQTQISVATGSPAPTQQKSDTIAKMAGAPLHPGIGSLKIEMSIGSAAGTPDQIVVGVNSVAVLPDGSLIISERGSSGMGNIATATVRQFDATGKYVRTFGRGGEGPGEYRDNNGVAALPDGRVLVQDGRGRKLNVYAADGRYLATWPTQETSLHPTSNRVMVASDGYIYVRIFTAPTTINTPSQVGFMRMDFNGKILDTLHPPPTPVLPEAQVRGKRADGTPRVSTVPFGPRFFWDMTRQGHFITGRTDRYGIDLLLPVRTGQGLPVWKPGDPVTSIRRNAPPVPTYEEERAAMKSSVERSMRSGDPGWTWTGAEIPRFKPSFIHMLTGLDGRIWVQVFDASKRYTVEELNDLDDTRDNFWDAFERDGRYLGRIRTTSGTAPWLSRGDQAWGITRDDDGVEKVVRMRIVWGTG